MKRVSWGTCLVLALMLTMAQQRPAFGGVVNGSVSLGTSGLSGTFELGFVFIDGSGSAIGDANNTVTLTNVGFGGGSAGAVDPLLTTTGASGDFTGGVTLIDSEFFNAFGETFTAGTLLTFDFEMTTNLDASGTPDQLSMVLFQSDGAQILSSDASGALLVANIDSAQPAFLGFATEFTPAPSVTLIANAPEPPTLLLMLALAGAVPLWRKRFRQPVTRGSLRRAVQEGARTVARRGDLRGR